MGLQMETIHEKICKMDKLWISCGKKIRFLDFAFKNLWNIQELSTSKKSADLFSGCEAANFITSKELETELFTGSH